MWRKDLRDGGWVIIGQESRGWQAGKDPKIHPVLIPFPGIGVGLWSQGECLQCVTFRSDNES